MELKINKLKQKLANKYINKALYFNLSLNWKHQLPTHIEKLNTNLYELGGVTLSKYKLINLIAKNHTVKTLQINLYGRGY
tara:strand:+ start:173 stop:412 length:240 start_codon:yes stop_codon:yes gene_type:complete